MGRRYTTFEYLRLVEVLRENMPGLGLTTDVIVGFPGETGDNFLNTCRMVQKVSFSGLHVFKFSPRRGTPAAAFAGRVDAKTMDARSRRLIQLGRKLSAQFASAHLGMELEVLAEQTYKGGGSLYEGLTGDYTRVVFPGDDHLKGKIVRVRAEKFRGGLLEGRIIAQ